MLNFKANEKKVLLDQVITPKQAQEILETCNKYNRPINPAVVKNFGSDLANGCWDSNAGQTIKFDTTGNLLDGQHRLAGCVIAGLPFTTDIYVGLHCSALLKQDIGKSRPLHINPVLDEARSRGVNLTRALFARRKFEQSIARLMIASEMGTQWSSPTEAALEQKLVEDAKAIEVATGSDVTGWKKKPGPRAAIGIFAKKDVKKAIEFRDKLFGDGSHFESGDPILVLREKLMEASKGGSKTRENLGQTISTIHKWIKGAKVKSIRTKYEWDF